ncbi:MAG: hypothetical protein ACYS18_11625 [Planctomycetota bacterium]|jgi:hypothetical protein
MLNMEENHEAKRYTAQILALLGLFALSLLVARFVITLKTSLSFSESIRLDYAGLSVVVPRGNGWQSDGKWKYYRNTFTLSSLFDSGPGGTRAGTHCQYKLAPMNVPKEVIFEQKAAAVDGSIEASGQKPAGSFTIDWVHIKKPGLPFDVFFGIAELPNNHQINIEVYQKGGDAELAKRVFQRVLDDIKLEDNQMLEAGSKIVSEIKSIGIEGFLYGRSQQSSYIIKKKVRGDPIGFMIETIIASNTQFDIEGGSLLYVRGQRVNEQVILFHGNNNFDGFVLKSQISEMSGRRSSEMVIDETAVMTVRSADSNRNDIGSRLSKAAMPDIFGDFIFSQMIDSDVDSVFIEIVDAEGKILPAFFARVRTEDISASQNFSYLFRIEFLDGRGFSQQIYLDDQRQIIRKVVRHGFIYTLERASVDDILEEFPERAEYITQKHRIPE